MGIDQNLKPKSVKVSSKTKLPVRYWGVDFARGIAVALMIVFHFLYDLRKFSGASIDLPSWYWSYMPEFIGSIFFSIIGISAWVKFKASDQAAYLPFAKRGLKIFLFGMLITLITAFMMPQHTVYFGVLHCIGICLLLIYPFLRSRKYNLLLGTLLVGLAILLRQYRFPFRELLWLGFWPEKGAGGDLYPLLPWFGVVLLGIWVGEKLYPEPFREESKFQLGIKPNSMTKGFSFLGKHSLVIYLVHQPLFVGLAYLLR